MTGTEPTRPKRSLFTLIADIPRLLSDLVRGELEALKLEITTKLKRAGIGIGLLVAASVFLFFAIGVLTAAGILGIATVLPAWLAALIVGGGLLVITAILAIVGIANLRKGVPPAPTTTINSLKKDVRAIKGIGKRSTP